MRKPKMIFIVVECRSRSRFATSGTRPDRADDDQLRCRLARIRAHLADRALSRCQKSDRPPATGPGAVE